MTVKRTSFGGMRTGRRKAVDIDSPRDCTVCFMVSAEEKHAIDELGIALNRTRSALLTQVVTGFIAAVAEGDDAGESMTHLLEYLKECQRSMSTDTPTQ